MKIAIFHLGFFYSGGGEKLILEEMRGLKALGHDVECFAPYVDKDGCFPDSPEMQTIKRLLPQPPDWLPMKDPLWVLLSCVMIPFLAPRFRQFDVFFGANQPGPWFAFVLGRILNKPYVIYLAQPLRTLHPREIDLQNGIRIREGDTRFINLMTQAAGWLIDKADRMSVANSSFVMTNGSYVSNWISEVYGVATVNCPAGCYPVRGKDLRYRHRRSGSLRFNGDFIPKPFMLLTNRHSPMKRFEYALWAMKAIGRTNHRISLVITGQETEYTTLLKYLVAGLGLEEVIHFVGLVTNENLAMLYGEALLYVYPSPEEDFGMGIVEAMAAGTPVVAWNNGGPTGIVIDRETGFLIEPYDVDSFTDKMALLSSNPALAESIGRKGHARSESHFSYAAHNRKLEETFAEAIEIHQQESEPDPPLTVRITE
ncbi:MAG: glycosyltransferase family 4 protein [Anaerolineales bacterium]